MNRGRLFLVCFLSASCSILALFPWIGSTGEYHTGGTLMCYDCHTMHFSMQHGFAGGTINVSGQFQSGGDWLGSTGPNQFLLKLPDTGLCLSCHDGQNFAPDVLGANTNGYVRQAGALNVVGGAAPYEDWKGHTLGMRATPPGGGSDITLTCGQCHASHGSSSYRNLKGAVPITYTKAQAYGSRTTTVDVWLKQWVQGDLAGNYASDSVRFNERNLNDSAYAVFCQGCHPVFHGQAGGFSIGGSVATGDFLRHPSAQLNIGAIGGGHSSIAQYNAGMSRVHVMSNSTQDYLANPGAGTFTTTDGLTPSCFSCHKAHGNENPFGLIFLDPTSITVTEEGTAGVGAGQGMGNLCGQCHVQGN